MTIRFIPPLTIEYIQPLKHAASPVMGTRLITSININGTSIKFRLMLLLIAFLYCLRCLMFLAYDDQFHRMNSE